MAGASKFPAASTAWAQRWTPIIEGAGQSLRCADDQAGSGTTGCERPHHELATSSWWHRQIAFPPEGPQTTALGPDTRGGPKFRLQQSLLRRTLLPLRCSKCCAERMQGYYVYVVGDENDPSVAPMMRAAAEGSYDSLGDASVKAEIRDDSAIHSKRRQLRRNWQRDRMYSWSWGTFTAR